MLPAFLQALLPSISLQSCSPCSTEKHRWDARCGMSSLPRFHPQAFGGCLRPAERMDVVLTALEAMVDSSIYDKEVACSVMAVAMEDHAFWLSDVSTLEKVLKELTKGSQLSRLLEGVTEDTCILFLALMAKSEDNEDFLGDLRHLKTYLKHPSVEMRTVVLRGLVILSETREKARKMEVVLPEIMATLQAASADVKMKALFVIQNIMGHVKRKEASSIAVQHAEELLPLFVDGENKDILALSSKRSSEL
ncbi:uncharacterized protein LOC124417416 [Gallus gallus]|uniref:uncharacterized protein LOC124417416 n=1 Tax=Gallus gallus TaxID=9031 RepID=UPI001F00076E|nr:uncharacterized protein LOC124417416 [Gallus gallus]